MCTLSGLTLFGWALLPPLALGLTLTQSVGKRQAKQSKRACSGAVLKTRVVCRLLISVRVCGAKIK